VLPVGHPTIPEMLTCLTAGACDVGFMGPDPSRAGVDFSPPLNAPTAASAWRPAATCR
jgi:hypothetical protein